MFKKVKDYFSSNANLEIDSTGKTASRDLQLATAVLLLEMAGRDSDYAPEEVKAVAKALKAQFHLTDDDVVEFLETADNMRGQETKIDRFVAKINQSFSPKQKQLIMSMIWQVASADSQIDIKEQRFVTELKNRLHLTDEQVAEAKVMKVDEDDSSK